MKKLIAGALSLVLLVGMGNNSYVFAQDDSFGSWGGSRDDIRQDIDIKRPRIDFYMDELEPPEDQESFWREFLGELKENLPCIATIGVTALMIAVPISKLLKIKQGIEIAGGLRVFVGLFVGVVVGTKSLKNILITFGPAVKEAIDIISGIGDIKDKCFSENAQVLA